MYITLFVLIILCIFVFSFLLFHIYSIEKKQKPNKPKTKKTQKKEKHQKHLPLFEATVGYKKPPFQLAVAANQPADTEPDPNVIVVNLPTFAAAAGPSAN
jgi:hypothetical protein